MGAAQTYCPIYYSDNRLLRFFFQEVRPALDLGLVWPGLEPAGEHRLKGAECAQCHRKDTYIYLTGQALCCGHVGSCNRKEGILEHLAGSSNGNGAGARPTGEALEQAVTEAARLAGVPMPEGGRLSAEERERLALWAERRTVLERVAQWCAAELWSERRDAAAARAYLEGRGLSEAAIRDLGLGLMTDAVRMEKELTSGEGRIRPGGLLAAGLRGERQCLRGYIIFPWHDEHGGILTLYGRWPAADLPSRVEHGGGWDLAGRAEIPKTHALVGMGSKSSPLYLDRVLRTRSAGGKQIVMVEGVLDAAVAQSLGDTRVCAYVAATLADAQVEVVARVLGKGGSVVICGDPDPKGREGVENSVRRLSGRGVRVYVAPDLPNDTDPDDFIRLRGLEGWKAHIAAAEAGGVWRARRALGTVGAHSQAQDKDAAKERLWDVLREVGDGSDREGIIGLACGVLGLSKTALRSEMKRAGADGKVVRLRVVPRPEATEKAGFYAKDKDIGALVPRVWAAIERANGDAPVLFRNMSAVAEVALSDDGACSIRHLTKERLRGVVARLTRWFDIKYGEEHPEVPPPHVIEDMLSCPDPPLPLLHRVVTAPVFAMDGSLQLEPGYHAASRTVYRPDAGVDALEAVPEVPSPEDVERAKAVVLNDLIVDFPFVDQAERANAVSLFVLGFVRSMIDGPTPMYLLSAPTQGTGKLKLIEALLIPALGRVPLIIPLINDEDELRKTLVAALLSGAGAVVVDNARGSLKSPTLESALTAYPTWSARGLATFKMVDAPVQCIWAITGNNVRLTGDMPRRVVRVRMDARVERPFERTGFKHEMPAWAHKNRALLVWCGLVLVRNWLAKGRRAGIRSLGSYEAWAAVVGGVLEAAGIEGFLANANAVFEESDETADGWRALVAAWWKEYGGADVRASVLYELVKKPENNVVIDLGRGTEHALRINFGKALMGARDQQFGDWRIENAGVKCKVQTWRLVQVGGFGVAQAW